MVLQLTKDSKDIIATDGRLWVDGRNSLNAIYKSVLERNDSFKKNFPHKIATGFRYKGTEVLLNQH